MQDIRMSALSAISHTRFPNFIVYSASVYDNVWLRRIKTRGKKCKNILWQSLYGRKTTSGTAELNSHTKESLLQIHTQRFSTLCVHLSTKK